MEKRVDPIEEYLGKLSKQGLPPIAVKIAKENKLEEKYIDIGYFRCMYAGERSPKKVLMLLHMSYYKPIRS